MAKSRKKFLIIDDIATNRTLLKIMCKKLGYNSDMAGSGKEALQMFKKNKYDLIFLDCQMPVMDGYEISQEIRKYEKGEHRIPIIAITAFVFTENREKCLNAGMDDFIAKPIKKHELKVLIEKWLKIETIDTEILEEKSDTSEYITLGNSTDGLNDDENVMEMFIESTLNKLATFKKYLENRDDKFCEISATGLKNNFKIMNEIKAMKICDDLIKYCDKKNYQKCEEIFDLLTNEFEQLAKNNNFKIKI